MTKVLDMTDAMTTSVLLLPLLAKTVHQIMASFQLWFKPQ
jgi:cell division inhibitor SulA